MEGREREEGREKNRFVDGSGGHRRRFPPDVHVFFVTRTFFEILV